MESKNIKDDYLIDTFHAVAPETISELAITIETVINDNLELDAKDVKKVSMLSAISFAKQCGGQQVYIPTAINLQNIERDYNIYSEFDGFNHNQLAKKFDCSTMTIYKTIKKIKNYLANK